MGSLNERFFGSQFFARKRARLIAWRADDDDSPVRRTRGAGGRGLAGFFPTEREREKSNYQETPVRKHTGSHKYVTWESNCIKKYAGVRDHLRFFFPKRTDAVFTIWYYI